MAICADLCGAIQSPDAVAIRAAWLLGNKKGPNVVSVRACGDAWWVMSYHAIAPFYMGARILYDALA
jgi:hypothetical protein